MRSRHNLLAMLVVAGAAGAILLTFGILGLNRAAVRERAEERLRAESTLLATWVRDAGDDRPAQELAVEASRRLGARITFIAENGIVLADSAVGDEGVPAMDDHASRPEIVAARTRGSGQTPRRSATTNVEYLYTALLVEGAGPIRYVRIAMPVSSLVPSTGGRALSIAAIIVAVIGPLIALGYVGIRRTTRPVEQMAQALGRSSTGDLGLELSDAGGAAVRRLHDGVQRIQDELSEKLSELDAERGVLASLISGMREALLLVGADRRVRLVNSALCEIFEVDFEPRGHLLEEVVRHPAVLDGVSSVLADGRESGASVVHVPATGRSFQLQVTPLIGADDEVDAALILLFDVTRLERLEVVRREFVANVSHELRTPLTSLTASVETLLEGGLEDRQNATRFLEIIRKHAQRMGELIEDLTDLSLIETGSIALQPREIDVAEAAREIFEKLRPLADTRGVELVLDLESPFAVIADRRRLEQILTNLLDNAVKFNNDGGSVRIRGDRHGTGVTLFVEDNGIGIPSDSHDKVFHRFHQVDRDRSRRVGGTGLGLAIVKHLMRLHGGGVRVESELGRGSTFALEFPKTPG